MITVTNEEILEVCIEQMKALKLLDPLFTISVHERLSLINEIAKILDTIKKPADQADALTTCVLDVEAQQRGFRK